MSQLSSLALISLPGARLHDLADLLAPMLHLPLVQDNLETDRDGIRVLPSDFLEKGGESSLSRFRDGGGVAVFLALPWEDSWRAVAPDGATNAQGLPWRQGYRILARERSSSLRKGCDLEVSPTGSLEELAHTIVSCLHDFRQRRDF